MQISMIQTFFQSDESGVMYSFFQNFQCIMRYEIADDSVAESLIVRLNVFQKGARNAYKKNLKMKHEVDKNIQVFGKEFKFQSIIVHHGARMGAGHFTCFTKLKKKWLHVDDSNFQLVLDEEMMFRYLKTKGKTRTTTGLVYVVTSS